MVPVYAHFKTILVHVLVLMLYAMCIKKVRRDNTWVCVNVCDMNCIARRTVALYLAPNCSKSVLPSLRQCLQEEVGRRIQIVDYDLGGNSANYVAVACEIKTQLNADVQATLAVCQNRECLVCLASDWLLLRTNQNSVHTCLWACQ